MRRASRFFKLALILVLSTFAVIGCSNKVKETSQDNVPSDDKVIEENSGPDHELPGEAGAYIRRGNQFKGIDEGDPSLLMATNAERGFGFALPTGTVVGEKVEDFTLKSTELKDTVLLITEYRGVALAVESPGQEVDDSTIAWIPVARHPVEMHILDKDSGLIDIHVKEALKPGFYILHDETMSRARHANEVTAYYPFIVQDKTGKRPWINDADECFKQFQETSGIIPGLDEPSEDVSKDLEKCLAAQRIAWKTEASAVMPVYPLRILLLRRMLYPDYAEIQRALKDAMDPNASELSSEIWKVVHSDHLTRLMALQQQADEGETLNASMVSMVVQYYLNQRGIGQPLRTMVWYPFARVDAESEVLSALFESVLSGKGFEVQLIGLLGAIEYRDIQQTVNRTHKLAPWFKALSETVPKSWRTQALSMKYNDPGASLIVGPFHFENIAESEWSSWRATIKSMHGKIESCFGGKSVLESTLLILDQPIHLTAPGINETGVLRDPIGELRSIPVVSTEALNCVLQLFRTLPSEPALESDKRIQVGIVWIKP